MDNKDKKPNAEKLVDIANFSFTIERVEEVGMAKIFTKAPYEKPDAYSVSWSEWEKDKGGKAIQAETEAQTYKSKVIQKFETYELAKKFFLLKIDEILQLYKEESLIKK